jgi:hypothetical protein
MIDFQHRSKHQPLKISSSHANYQHQHTDSTTMPQPSSILVLGAGELGSEVLQSLASNPSRGDCQISLLLRASTLSNPSPTKQAELQILHRDAQISFVTGDITSDSISQLTVTLAPFDTVISCTGMSLPPGSQLKLTRAVLAARVRRYFPWQFGIDYDAIGRASAQDLFDEQLDVRELLQSQEETKWVIVSTGMFMSFLFEPAFGVVDLRIGAGSVAALGSWENELTVTAVEDIGRVVAELALVEVEEEGLVFVAGDTVSMRRLADVVEVLHGEKIKRDVKTVDQLKSELVEEPDDVMRKYRVVFAAGVGVSWEKQQSFNAKHGMETVLVEDWAEKNLSL